MIEKPLRGVEAARRESEERQAFLLKLSDALAPLSDSGAIQAASSRLLGEHIRANRVCYVEVHGAESIVHQDYVSGVRSLAGRWPNADYGKAMEEALRSGRTNVVTDIAAMPGLSEGERANYQAIDVAAQIVVTLLKEGRWIANFGVHSATPRAWTKLEIQLTEDTAERTWAAVERARAEAALRESEEKYRSLFESMGQGYAECELIRDADGRAIDFRYIELNPAYERLTGIAVADALGRTTREVIPGFDDWRLATYDRIVRGGRPERLEYEVAELGRWYEVHVHPRSGDRFTAFYEEITDRKRAEAALRASEERQAFLLKLSDDFRARPEEKAIGLICVEAMARRMGVDRCYITEMPDDQNRGIVGPEFHAPNLHPVSGSHSYDDYPDAARRFRSGVPMICADVANDPALSDADKASIAGGLRLQAILRAASYRGEGRSIWALTIGSATPRAWTGDDLRLVQDVGERTWAAIEGARAEAAVRENQARLALEVEDARVLQTISNQLVSEPGVNGHYGHIIEAARVLMRADAASIQELDTARSMLKLVAHVGFHRDSAAFWEWVEAGSGSACGRALAAQDRIVVPDTDQFEAGPSELAAFRQSGIVAVQSSPLISRNGQIVGMMSTHWRHRHTPNDESYRFFDILARLAADFMERARADAKLRESEERFQQFAAASSGALWIRDAATLKMEYVSPSINSIYGIAQDDLFDGVESWAKHIVPDDRAIALEHIESARRGESVAHEFRIQRASDGAFRWIRDTDFPLRDAQGRIQRIGGIAEDVTEAKLAVERQRVLMGELQHRVRNIMAMIRAVAARTEGSAKSIADYAALMEGRLTALARTQTLLTRAANLGVDIADVVGAELDAQAARAGQYTMFGRAIILSPKAAEVLSLAVHELATNALKYGAFATEEGRVEIAWRVRTRAGAPWLYLTWAEHRPAPANWSPPTRYGFGMELVERRVPYELGGEGSVTITADGARASIAFPLQDGDSILETGAPLPSRVFGGSIDMSAEADLSGKRILVLEDDYYLASDAALALRSAGADVVGPFATERAALASIAASHLSAALVDINLGSGSSFNVAEALWSQGVPFVFATGYDQSVIPPAFVDVARFEKPVDLRKVVRALADLFAAA